MTSDTKHYPKESSDFDVIDLSNITSVFWRSRHLILTIAATITSAALLFGWTASSYRSEGYFQMEMSLSDFKRLQVAIAAPLRWENFAKTLNKSQLAEIRQEGFQDPGQLQAMIAPIYPVTRSEMKDIPNPTLKDGAADIAGLKISYKGSTPSSAQQGVLIFGNFLRDTAILLRYREMINKRYTEYQNAARKYDNDAINAKYALEQLKIKKTSMQSIMRDYPDSMRFEGRQLETIIDGNERFLSPVTQLVAIETEIAEKTRELPRIVRDQQFNAINLRYYQQLQELLNNSTSGNTFLAALPELKDRLKLNLDDEVERSVSNNIAMENLNARSLYLEKTAFIAPPLLPQKAAPGLPKSGLLGLLLGLILGCIVALLRHWLTDTRLLQPHLSDPDQIDETTVPKLTLT